MKDIVILDGGMGQELMKRIDTPTEMWSAQVLMDAPALVELAHIDYINAGADVITINAYSATPERLAAFGHAEKFHRLQNEAINCAARARAQTRRDVKITGCLPPLYTSYNPDLHLDHDHAVSLYREIVEVQKDGVDVLLAETIGSLTEARAALVAMEGQGKPIWMSLTIDDDDPEALRSGEPLSEAVEMIDKMGVSALLLNCSTPETITRALPHLKATHRDFGAYANGFVSVPKMKQGDIVTDVIKERIDLSPDVYAEFAVDWVRMGATLIGGCCNVGPLHIAELSRRFKE